MMRSILVLSLLPGLASAQLQPAKPGSKAKAPEYISMTVQGSLANAFDISEYRFNIREHVSAFGGSLSFSGQPLSGSMYMNGSYWSISGGQVFGNVNKGFNSLSVSATVYKPQGGSRQLYFTLQANGRMDDPNFAPSFSVFGGDASLNAQPVFNGREYQVSGSVDSERFGAEGAALTALVLAGYMSGRQPKTQPVPKAGWLEKSPLLAPVLQSRGVIPLR